MGVGGERGGRAARAYFSCWVRRGEKREEMMRMRETNTLFGVTISSLRPIATEWLISASVIVPLSFLQASLS